ncbi:MAG: DUF892 family protein [Fibrobacter sp.]|nr:DUF892 family protein [Fibrobacter sp.]
MGIYNTRELYIKMLSDVLKREERVSEIFTMLREIAQDSRIKELLDSAMYLTENSCASLDRCFKMIGEKPVASESKLLDVFIDDFKRELESIQAPVAKVLYIASKASHLIQIRIGELETLVLMSDMNGHPGVSLLLDSVLSQKQVFIDRILGRFAEVLQGENK